MIYIFPSMFFLIVLLWVVLANLTFINLSIVNLYFLTTIYSFLSFLCFNDAYKSSKVILYSMKRVAFAIITNSLFYSLLVDFHSWRADVTTVFSQGSYCKSYYKLILKNTNLESKTIIVLQESKNKLVKNKIKKGLQQFILRWNLR